MIKVVGKKYVTPFSKGIMAGSLIKAGLDVDKAYQMTEDIQQKIVELHTNEITEEDLTTMTYQALLNAGHIHAATYYRMWHAVREKKRPIVILLGGATGIGKSSVAFEISHRLGIHSIIGTDTVREVMRKIISKDLLPTLHTSSFNAWKEIQAPSSLISSLIYAFELQVSHVSVGVNAIIQRAVTEGISLVMEGIHLVPGHIHPAGETIFHFVLQLSDREEHINRFHARAKDSKRPPEYYINEIDRVRQVQDHIVGRAHRYEVPVLENKTIEGTVTQIVDSIHNQLQKEAETHE